MRLGIAALLIASLAGTAAAQDDNGYDEVMHRAQVDPPDQPLDDRPYHGVTVTILGKEITYGADGPPERVWLNYSRDGSDTDLRRFDHGKQVAVGDSEHAVFTGPIDGFTLIASIAARTIPSSDRNAIALRAHDDVAAFMARRHINPAFGHQKQIAEVLKAYTGPDGKIQLADNQRIVLFELGTRDPADAAFDFQDLVVLLTFDHPAKQGDF